MVGVFGGRVEYLYPNKKLKTIEVSTSGKYYILTQDC